ncbi:DNA polymerase ligase N-terminal domain-containing protein [Caballeronia telluris]
MLATFRVEAITIMASIKDTASPPLHHYRKKRNFAVTPEPAAPAGRPRKRAGNPSFVVQKHWASRLHYDFRLQQDKEKRMALHVEDHPLDYAQFEGAIPPKQYGAGAVIVWDRGTWEPVRDARAAIAAGKLIFRLHGEKLAGLWELVRISKPDDKADQWMFFKKRDEWARPIGEYDVIKALPDSVVANSLGLVEEREPKTPRRSHADEVQLDLSAALPAPLPAKLEP